MDKNIINQVKKFISEKNIAWIDLLIKSSKIDLDTLNQIFFVIYEHTNSFRNTNTSKELIAIIPKLLDLGVVHDKIIVEKTKTELIKMKLFWEVLSKVIKNIEWNIIWATLDRNLFDKYQIDFFCLNELIDQLLFSIKDVEVVFFCIKWEEKSKIVRFKNKRTKKLQDLLCVFEKDSMNCNTELLAYCMKCDCQ
jgi:nanoRNase/pAp phosphatase (c-di-AMP/oligoRNAs hydrolase)